MMRGRTGASPIVAYAVVAAIVLAGVSAWVLSHGGHVCQSPSVPVRSLDARLDSVGCATLTEDRAMHGIWIDGRGGSLFYPDATDLPERDVTKGDSWLMIDRETRARIAHDLPVADGLLTSQIVAISFYGNEYRLDRPTPSGLRRVYDVRDLRSVHLLRRAFASARTVSAP